MKTCFQLFVARTDVNSNQTNLPSQFLIAMLAIPMVIALGISGYLTYASLTASEIAGCGGGSLFDCGHVLNSKWSKFAGFPVSGLAVVTYLGMISASVFVFNQKLSSHFRTWAWTAVTGLAIAASFAAAYFIFLQVVVLQHLCWYCLVAHTCGIIIATTAIYRHKISMPKLSGMTSAVAMGLAVLITVQLNTEEPPKFKIESYNPDLAQANIRTMTSSPSGSAAAPGDDLFAPPTDGDLFEPPSEDELFAPPVEDDKNPETAQKAKETLEKTIAVTSLLVPTTSPSMIGNLLWYPQDGPASQQPAKPEQEKKEKVRVVAFSGNKLNVAQWPLAGSPKASYIFAEMFDYTCPHCRKMHKTIKAAKSKLDDDVAIVSLPVPMNRACNPTVQNNNAVHSESCQLSNLAVGVWRVDTAKFDTFHEWMFETPTCPTYSAAYQKAAELVGKEKLDQELAKGIAKQYVQKHVLLYQRVGGGQIPKTLFPTSTIVGEYNSPDGLAQMIKEKAGK